MKWDGHTHTQFCAHGSGDPTALMVERAIALGFERYSIVEHAPIPLGVIDQPIGSREFGLLMDELPDYIQHVKDLKTTYGVDIEIRSGLEIDYFPGFEGFTRALLNDIGSELDEVILSLHFLPTEHGFLSLDHSPQHFAEGLLETCGDIGSVHYLYWSTLRQMVTVDFTLPSTRRIGHIGLINKYIKKFTLPFPDRKRNTPDESLFRLIKTNGWAIDFNVSGLSQQYCQDVYLSKEMLDWCRKLDINLVYGSDAHGVDAVGRYYQLYERLVSCQTD
jgi:histidinol-phosphatase (PHP family)